MRYGSNSGGSGQWTRVLRCVVYTCYSFWFVMKFYCKKYPVNGVYLALLRKSLMRLITIMFVYIISLSTRSFLNKFTQF